ncbi:hypothetical protein ACQ4PT_021631 [Festuca glaucescens]
MGGVCICVRPDVDYFDVKFPDSVQGWRKKWLYIQEEYIGNQEYRIAPFDGAAGILRRRSWDAEATAEEKTKTEALMKRIHQLQNTRGKELSGVQITAHFLRIRVQPLQARQNPLWLYAGEKDIDRMSKNLSVKDLERLIRRFSSLSKKHEVPNSCRVEPYSGSHALPKNHQILSCLPPLPEGGEVDERAVVTDDPQESSRPESKVAGSHKSAASSEKETESDRSESDHSISPPLALSPRNKRKRNEVDDSGTSKPPEAAAEEASPEEGDTFDPYDGAGSVSSSEEEKEELAVLGTAPTSTSNTVILSEENRTTVESSPPPQQNVGTSTPPASPQAPSPKRARTGAGDGYEIVAGGSSTAAMDDPVMKHLLKLGTQFIGYRDAAEDMRENLNRAEKHAEELAAKLELSEKARKKAEQEAATVEDLRQRLHEAENALSDKVSQQIARESAIIARLEAQNRWFVRKMGEGFTLHEAEEDRLLDTLSILELHGDLARTNIFDARVAFTRLFPHFFPKQTQPQIFSELVQRFLHEEDLAMAYRQDNLKIGVEGTIALVANSGQEVDWAKAGNPEKMNKEKWKALVKDAKPHSKKILAFLSPKPAASTSTAKTEVK